MAPIDYLLILVLLVVAIEDWRRYRIRNAAILVLAACVLVTWLDGRHASIWPHALLAGAAFVALVGAFALGWIGGGDAKLLVLALAAIGPEGALVFSLALLAFVALHAGGAKLGLAPGRRVGGRLQIPFGPGIAGAWIAVIILAGLL